MYSSRTTPSLLKIEIYYPFSAPVQTTSGEPTKETAGQPTKETAGQPTQKTATSNDRIIYIVSGIAFILLLVLGFIIGFWCYRKLHHKRIKRLFTVVVTTYLRRSMINSLVIAKLGQLTGETVCLSILQLKQLYL